MTIQKFNMSIGGRSLHLLFDLEDEFYSDRVLNYMLPRGQLPEPEVLHALPHILEPGDCCVDAGANIGFFTVIMSKLVGKDGCVIAIEPDPRNARKLRKNLDINDCMSNVLIYEAPLATKAGPAKFYVRSENGSSTLYDGATAGELVEVLETQTATLTTLIGDRKPKFMKMDIEGAEFAAIQNCSRKIPFVISEINEEALGRADATVAQLRFYLENVWGHALHVLSETGGMPARIDPQQTIKPTKANANVLFARQWDVVKTWPKVII